MTSMTRWNPFKSLARIDPSADFDDFFRGFGLRPRWNEMAIAPDVRINVTENDTSYRVEAEIPGVEKNAIDVSINGDQVSISAEVKRETKEKDGHREILTERSYGQVYRSFTLPGEVDNSKATAHYENGLLTLDLPKKKNGSARKLSVS